jgi:hypothetical protein
MGIIGMCRLTGGVLAILLVFTSSAQATKTPKPGDAGAGYVVMSFPSLEFPVSVSVRSIEKKDYDVPVLSGTREPTAGVWLPAGDYRLIRWAGREVADYASFHVNAGAVSDLGGLVPIEIGGYRAIVVPVRTDATATAAKDAVKALAEQPVQAEPIAWPATSEPLQLADQGANSPLPGLIPLALMAIERNHDKPPMSERLSNDKDNRHVLDVARESAVPVMRMPAVDDRKRLLFGAELGQIRVRDEAGLWSSIDTGSLHRVTALGTTGHTIVAGMDDGSVRSSLDGGAHWVEVSRLDCERGRVTDVSFSGTQWAVTVVGLNEWNFVGVPPMFKLTRACIYLSGDTDPAHLARKQRVDFEPRLMVNALRSYVTPTDYFVGVPPDIMKLNLSTGNWQRLPLDGSVDGFSYSGANGTVVAFHPQGVLSKVFLSPDGGATWKRIARPPNGVSDLRFISPTEGYAVRIDAMNFSAERELYRYDATRDDWTVTKKLPADCVGLLKDADGKPAYCLSRGGSILNLAQTPMAVEYLRD